MAELTAAANLAWRIAALEAQRGQAGLVSPDHLAVGLLSLDKLLEPAAGLGVEQREAVRSEQAALLQVLGAAGLDPTSVRRALRQQIPDGRSAPERVPQRDRACLAIFARADALAEQRGDTAYGVLDLLAALLERPSLALTAAVGDPERLRRRVEMALRPVPALSSVFEPSPATSAPSALQPSSPPSPAAPILPPAAASPLVLSQAVMSVSAPEPAPSSAGLSPSPPVLPPTPAVPPVLLRFGRDLTAEAESGRLPPVVGRHDEMLQVARVLRRRTKNGPVLVGEAGVGKTAVVEGLAQLIAEGAALPGRRIIALSIASVVAGTSYRGQFEERLEEILASLRAHPELILFLDELHTIVGAGDADGRLDAASILKPALSRGEIACIGATTLDEYRRHIESDPALERRFQPILVTEPTPAEALAILAGVQADLERHHGVRIEPAALGAAVDLTVRHVPNRRLPDKAVDALDEACARASMPSLSIPSLPAPSPTRPPLAVPSPSPTGPSLSSPLPPTASTGGRDSTSSPPLVTADTVAAVVSAWTGLALGQLWPVRTDGAAVLADLEARLSERIVGQDAAIRQVGERVRLARAGLSDPERPAAVFLWVGRRGVGKAALAQALAEVLADRAQGVSQRARADDHLIHLTMSAYAEPHQAVRLIGTPAGPRSVADDGLLTGPLRRAPRAMVLLSEIDRAHPDMIDLLLPLLATGRLTDGQGRIVDGRQAIFVLTTDLEVAGAGRRALGFGSAPVQSAASDRTAAPDQTDLRDTLRATLRATFSSDLLGCIDEIVHFRPLAEADLLELARRQVAALARRLLAQHQIELTISSGALALLARRALAATGGQPDSGYAQTVQRAVTRLLSEPISRELLAGRIQRGARVLAEPHGDTIVFVSQPGSA